MKLIATYTNPDGQPVEEIFPGVPQGAYAAVGFQKTIPGALFVRRLCQGGTCLISLHNSKGAHVRTHPDNAGKILVGHEWKNE